MVVDTEQLRHREKQKLVGVVPIEVKLNAGVFVLKVSVFFLDKFSLFIKFVNNDSLYFSDFFYVDCTNSHCYFLFILRYDHVENLNLIMAMLAVYFPFLNRLKVLLATNADFSLFSQHIPPREIQICSNGSFIVVGVETYFEVMVILPGIDLETWLILLV